MPLDLQIIRANEFLRLGVGDDKINFETSRKTLKDLATACRKRGIDRALLDLREVPLGPIPLLTHSELTSLVNTFREIGFTDEQRLAVLYAVDPHHGVRLFAFISSLKGWTVAAFDDFEDAIVWLSSDMPSAAGIRAPHGDPVQIRSNALPDE
jgi:hypothetical protein